MKLIGLVGLIGSGKGTAGEILEKHGFIKESFARSVKDAISVVFGWERSLLEGDTTDSRAFREAIDPYWSKAMGRDFSPRIALQLMGTEAGRDVFHPDIWVHSLIRRLKPDNNYVITDVRFPNEMKTIKENGGKMIWVQRGALPEWYDNAAKINWLTGFDPKTKEVEGLPHYSEWAWVHSPYIDVRIENNGTLEDLEKAILNEIK